VPADTFRDPSRSVEERVEDLLGRMTLDEKLAQLGGVWLTDLMKDDSVNPEMVRETGSGRSPGSAARPVCSRPRARLS
jgi:hypothetical protein